jgi:hypothetical protein
MLDVDDLMDLGLDERKAQVVRDRMLTGRGLASLARMKGRSIHWLNEPPGVDEPEVRIGFVDLGGGPTLCKVNGEYRIGTPEGIAAQMMEVREETLRAVDLGAVMAC